VKEMSEVVENELVLDLSGMQEFVVSVQEQEEDTDRAMQAS
jgi:hypothetical protein